MNYLGIEIGGTKLQLGVGVGDGGPLAALERREVDADRGAAGIREQIEAAALPLIRRHHIARVGIGFGGPVNPVRGRTTISHQVDGWRDFPLVEWCRERLGLDAQLGNDCDVAALAEARFGAGRGVRRVFYVTVGTGVGGGFVIDGRLYGGDRPAAAEIGHLRPGLDRTDPHATVESLTSGRGIECHARERLRGMVPDDDAAELLSLCAGDVRELTGKHIAAAARDGNAIALDVWRQATGALGWAVAQVVTLLAPERVVIGGGVSLAGEELFFEPVRRSVAEYVFPPLAETVEVVPAALGEEVVIHGALALAADSAEGT